MAILTSPSGAVPTSLVYITLGTLMDIWTIVAMVYYPPETAWGKFLSVGFLVTGLALLVIGLLLGPIGRAARHAELPPTEVTPAVTQTEMNAAEHPPAVVPGAAQPIQTNPANNGVATAASTAPVAPVAPVAAVVQKR